MKYVLVLLGLTLIIGHTLETQNMFGRTVRN